MLNTSESHSSSPTQEGEGNVGYTVPRRLHSVKQAEDWSGESRSTLYAAMKAGTLKFVKMGRSTRIEHDELNRYIDAKIAASS